MLLLMLISRKGLIRVLSMSISSSRNLGAYINRAKPIEFKYFLYKEFLDGLRPDYALEFIIAEEYYDKN